MTLLAELFGQLEATPEDEGRQQAATRVGMVEAVTLAPAINQTAYDVPHATAAATPTSAAAPATEGTHEPYRSAWTVTRGGKPICTVVSSPMTRDEALAEARWRWPDADILEN